MSVKFKSSGTVYLNIVLAIPLFEEDKMALFWDISGTKGSFATIFYQITKIFL